METDGTAVIRKIRKVKSKSKKRKIRNLTGSRIITLKIIKNYLLKKL